MNIVFIVPSLSPFKGGVERVSSLLANYFSRYGINSYALTLCSDEEESDVYVKSMSLCNRKDRIICWLKDNNIELLINQLSYSKRAVQVSQEAHKKGMKIISSFHGPANFYHLSIQTVLRDKTLSCVSIPKLRAYFKRFLLHYYEPYGTNFRNSYRISSKFVLLSNRFITPFYEIYQLPSKEKIIGINNPLSFTRFYDKRISDKYKTVLIVSRICDTQKRISLSLKIWKEIEKHPVSNDWKLIIIGKGRDDERMRRLALDLKLKRCVFIGEKKNVIDYYAQSSLFFMVSSFEGWGLTITEAMQMGCVPIAFNSYLTLTEIIDNGINGIVVSDGDITGYVESALRLMSDKKYREKIAIQGIEKARTHYSIEIIAKKWIDLIKNTTNVTF